MMSRIQRQKTFCQHFLSCVIVNITCNVDLRSLGNGLLIKVLTAATADSYTLNHAFEILFFISDHTQAI